MSALELKVPPPVVALVIALFMWVVAAVTPNLALPAVYRVAGTLALFVAGFAVRAIAQLSFVRARTTINPLSPSGSSALVSAGIYRYTRNPMYLGRLLQLAGWAVFLSNALAALLVPVYVLYINRFQVRPEERALLERFGSQYAAYQQKVPRWL
ncbi:methyltransferase family protein [Ideonella sp. BN130291]|uniref:methyltransferase family protein n=1 Tax=Ideonella sp. BN130291 TaxID=3112940 RepID=UPI002E254D76|nr:isoprenylcysteine carboxylmethyltransferase family protein [Ideonella sp. BN130291]